ncbi:hypothetical protein IRJ41_017195, partial [Triplophysa rosa]
MEDERSLLPASKWMITTVQGTEMQEKGILGQRKSNHLPPLTGRQEVPLNVGLETGSQSVCDKTGDSIVKSHPPQPAKDTEWRDGPVHHYSTPSQGEHCGTNNTVQGHMKGLLLAQTMLSRQATKKRQAQQKCFRERRGRQKRVYTSETVEGNEMEDRQRVRLVSRPTERNIFWDESEGQILDVRDLLQPSPELIDPEYENGMKIKPQTDRGFESEVEDWNFEGPVMKSCRKSLCKTHINRGL